jgi:uncharacterized protein YwgA
MYKLFINLLNLVNATGRISGRKKFQKLVYILKHKGFNFKEDYSYYYYGPYSSVLQMEIDDLVRSELLDESLNNNTYEYSITDKAYEYVRDSSYSEEQVSLINMLNQESAYILELVSVFFYLEDSGYNNQNAILKKTRILKPELVNYIGEAYSLYSRIKEFKVS